MLNLFLGILKLFGINKIEYTLRTVDRDNNVSIHNNVIQLSKNNKETKQ